MRGLFVSAREGKQVITAGLIRDRIRALCGEDVSEDIKSFIERGDTLTFTGDELGPCFELDSATEEAGPARLEGTSAPQFRRRQDRGFDQPECLGELAVLQ